ncbi:putative myo-inositol transporter 2, partial [Wallemia mellicola]
MSKTFTLEDKKRFNGTVEHVEDVDSKSNTKPKFVDVDEKVLLAEGEDKITPYIIFVCITAAVAGFMFGYETGIIGTITISVGMDLGVDINAKEHENKKEIITAMTGAGAFICSIFAGALSDKIGRKWVLVISDICYCIGTVVFGASYSVAQAAVGRLILGFGV